MAATRGAIQKFRSYGSLAAALAHLEDEKSELFGLVTADWVDREFVGHVADAFFAERVG